jgi:hypothetical protein
MSLGLKGDIFCESALTANSDFRGMSPSLLFDSW